LGQTGAGDPATGAGPLHFLSATEALGLFRAGRLRPSELMEAVIRRAEVVEPQVNAFADTYFEEALTAAHTADGRYANGTARPLEGLAVAVKEETPVRGQRTTQGSLVCRDAPPESESAVVIDRVLAAGGIVHARATAPEFSCATFTHSRLWGVTRNPWNLQCAPGGSSGGSAATLAAGTSTLATGSDIGGSIRIPASFCGVVGYKPPYGRLPEMHPYNLDHYASEGPLARTVADCALLENVMAGPDAKDIASLRPKLLIPEQLEDISGWRMAYSLDLGAYAVDPAVARNTLQAVESFREAGATVEEVELDWNLRDILDAAHAHWAMLFGASVAAQLAEHRELMTPYAIRFAEELAAYDKTDYVRGLGIETEMYNGLGPLLERYRVLLCPTMGIHALEAGREYLDEPPSVDGVVQQHRFDILMTLPFNICGRCPAISVPSGFADCGVPTGLQIVGRTYDDVSVFQAAMALEQVRAAAEWPALATASSGLQSARAEGT
jgi:aspartyl-tRNA(Asn)/glutamyl-tRNA(Gln) amidotransferase subunit A